MDADGREKLHFLNPVPIRLVHDRWLSKYRAPFAAALSDLKSRLEGREMAETQVYEVFIRTTPEKLWQALTDAPKTPKHVSQDSWTLILSGLKTLLGTGEPMPVPAA